MREWQLQLALSARVGRVWRAARQMWCSAPTAASRAWLAHACGRAALQIAGAEALVDNAERYSSCAGCCASRRARELPIAVGAREAAQPPHRGVVRCHAPRLLA